MRFVLAAVLSTIVLGWALWRGGGPERAFAATLIATLAADPVYHAIFGPPLFDRVDLGHVVIDGFGLAAIFTIALRANRAWPILACAIQVIVCLGHLARYLELDGAQGAYWAMTQVPVILHLIVLSTATAFHTHRKSASIAGADWRTA